MYCARVPEACVSGPCRCGSEINSRKAGLHGVCLRFLTSQTCPVAYLAAQGGHRSPGHMLSVDSSFTTGEATLLGMTLTTEANKLWSV